MSGDTSLLLPGLFIAIFVVCFLIGSLNPAHGIATLRGFDIRGEGSGNPGATNAGRLLGVRWGIVVGLLDVLKGFLPLLLVSAFAGRHLVLVAGLAVVLGHMFSPFLKGHGGKGVATAFGATLAIAPWVAMAGVAVFVVAALLFRTIGRGALIAFAVVFVVGVLRVLDLVDWFPRLTGWWLLTVAALVLSRHWANFTGWIRTRA